MVYIVQSLSTYVHAMMFPLTTTQSADVLFLLTRKHIQNFFKNLVAYSDKKKKKKLNIFQVTL